MAPPIRQNQDVSEPPSKSLWVGSLSNAVTDSDLTNLFSEHGVCSVSSFPSRGYGFVNFKRFEDAKAALDALRGTVLHGSLLKIEFARPAKPCKSLWVTGLSEHVPVETLEEEFLKFGKIEEFKFLRERKTAFVDFLRLEDASQALKSMNGKQIGGDRIHVDFFRSHILKRKHLADHRDAREGQFLRQSMGPLDSPQMPQDVIRTYSDPHSGFIRQQHPQSSGVGEVYGQPSNILRVDYPPSVCIDEQMLHNAMILFGEIESIKCFPSRNCSFVGFRSVDEARRAKEGLQGRLFNDPRISIIYSSNELGPRKDYPVFLPQTSGPRLDVSFNGPPFQYTQGYNFNHDLPKASSTIFGPEPSSSIIGPNMPMRLFGPPGPAFRDANMRNRLPDANFDGLMGGQNWSRLSPAPGMLPYPSPGMNQPIRPVSSGLDVLNANQLQREPKRFKIDTVMPVGDSLSTSKEIDNQGLALDQLRGHCVGAPSIQEKKWFSPEVRIPAGRIGQGHHHDYIWRGVIAKGGEPICHARCVPFGKWIQSDIPDVVNCSAKTSLDMLTKHYADAIEQNVVFFLPDSEEDFASYTELLKYFVANNRVGVAKFDDGTALFVVPPSDFLSKVLNISGPERLYGVLLKLPQHAGSSTSMQPQSQPHCINRLQLASQNENSGMPPTEEKVLQVDYKRVLPKDSLPPANELAPSISYPLVLPVPSANTAAMSQAGVTLTPELVATLASLLPASAKPFGSESAQLPLGSSSIRPLLPHSSDLGSGLLPQGWKHNHLGTTGWTGHPLHQVEHQCNPQGQVCQLQTYTTSLNTSINASLGVTGLSLVQDPAYNIGQVVPGAVSSRPLGTLGIPPQSGNLGAPHVHQQHQHEVLQNIHNGFGMSHGADSLGSHGSSIYQQHENSVSLSNQVSGNNVTPRYIAMPLGADNGSSELTNQIQMPQSAPYGTNQGTLEAEVDKNRRYQSTLQLAAKLLLQLQQQQQQTSTQAGQGSANQ